MSFFLKERRKSPAYFEGKAASWLKKRGYKIIKRNFRSYCGEIDIVAMKDRALHFVEVKARRSFKYGKPSEAINKSKIRHIVKTTEVFLKYFPEFKNYDLKFDVLSISFCEKDVEFELLENILI